MTLLATLSPRETAVLHLSAWGHSNKEIGVRLDIAVKTVEAHKFNGMRKLRITDRVQLVRYAIREGWLHLDDCTASSAPANDAGAPASDQNAGV